VAISTYCFPSRLDFAVREHWRSSMKRFAIILGLAASMLLPGTTLAFHHTGLPATFCHAVAAGSPSNDNGQAKEALTGHAGLTLPLPPVGTPGNGQGDGGEHCANAE
jgi:hypothetical protein